MNHGVNEGVTWCMTRRSNSKLFTPFADPDRKARSRRGNTPSSVHNIYSFYELEASESQSEEIGEVDIDTIAMEQ
ncbi:hypothetical protein Tco_1202561 [Tanacetum coccineum]